MMYRRERGQVKKHGKYLSWEIVGSSDWCLLTGPAGVKIEASYLDRISLLKLIGERSQGKKLIIMHQDQWREVGSQNWAITEESQGLWQKLWERKKPYRLQKGVDAISLVRRYEPLINLFVSIIFYTGSINLVIRILQDFLIYNVLTPFVRSW